MTPRPFSIEFELRRFEARLGELLDAQLGPQTPPRLAAAIRFAVFSGAGRLRPALGMAISHALGVARSHQVLTLCAAVELVHTASLIHDDLPCFDDASIRRGQPSVHAKFGEALAVLAGDALISLAYAVLASEHGPQTVETITLLAKALGPSHGIIGGQALECEPCTEPDAYHDAKTGALFSLLGEGIAVLAGIDNPQRWGTWGAQIGRIYQRCDDLSDLAPIERTGKPPGQDERHARPRWAPPANALCALRTDLERWLQSAPPCTTRSPLSAWSAAFERRLLHRVGQ